MPPLLPHFIGLTPDRVPPMSSLAPSTSKALSELSLRFGASAARSRLSHAGVGVGGWAWAWAWEGGLMLVGLDMGGGGLAWAEAEALAGDKSARHAGR